MLPVLTVLLACNAGYNPVIEPAPVQAAHSEHGLVLTDLEIAGNTVTAEIADTPALRRQGLMHRPSMAEDHGMIFVYPDAQPRSFWMKNTLLPLSIAYIDQHGQIVHIADMMPMDESPVPSNQPAMYALEMPQGWFDAHQITPGMQVSGLPSASHQ